MDWHEVVRADLPPPFEDEPAHLRRDIEDELTDHLACGFHRELERGSDEAEARRAALERFGNPRKIARQLWFDAMKEQIVKQRILLAAVVVLALGVLAALALAWMSMDQAQRANRAMLQAVMKLTERGAPSGSESNWARLRVRVVTEGTNPQPVVGIRADLSGSAFKETPETLTERADANGVCSFGPIHPGRYTLSVQRDSEDSGSFWASQAVMLYASGEGKEIVLRYPEPPLATVHLRIPLPELAAEDVFLQCGVACVRKVGGQEWSFQTGSAWLTARGEQFWDVEFGGMGSEQAKIRPKAQRGLLLPCLPVSLSGIEGYGREAHTERPIYRRLGGHNFDGPDSSYRFVPKPGIENQWTVQLAPADRQWLRSKVFNVLAETRGPGVFFPDAETSATILVKDGTVRASQPDASDGAGSRDVRLENGYYPQRALLQWRDVPPELASRPDCRFVLALCCQGGRADSGESRLAAHELLADWAERTATWKTLPEFTSAPVAVFDLTADAGWKFLDVTALIRDQAQTRRASHGILLRFDKEQTPGPSGAGTMGFQFWSREAERAEQNKRPQLLIVRTRKPQ